MLGTVAFLHATEVDGRIATGCFVFKLEFFCDKNKEVRFMAGLASEQSIVIKLRAFDHQVLDGAAEKIVETAKSTGAMISGPVPLPTNKEVPTILRAPFKYKDSREQFEIRTHKRLIIIACPTPKTVDSLMHLDLPAGVDIEIKLLNKSANG